MRSDRAALQPLPEKLLQKEEEPRDRKAVIALARKFLGIIYRTAKNKWLFEDFPNIALAEATARQLPPTPPLASSNSGGSMAFGTWRAKTRGSEPRSRRTS
jgi:hypothetical protein